MADDPELGGITPSADYMAEAVMKSTAQRQREKDAVAEASRDETRDCNAPALDNGPHRRFSLSSVLCRWERLLRTIHIALHVVWIRLHQLVFGELFIRYVYGQPSQLHRRVVVVGDDLALGVGDWVTLCRYPGLQRRINDKLEATLRKRSSRVVRGNFTWTATCVAVSGSTAAQWLPRSARELVGGALFESVFDRHVGTDTAADIVCVLLGAHTRVLESDECIPHSTSTSSDSFENDLTKICAELMRRGKYVLVVTVPLALRFQCDPGLRASNKRKNDAIRSMVHRLRAAPPDGAAAVQLTLVDVSQGVGLEVHWRFGGRLLSGRGYDAIAAAVLAALVPCVDAVETRNLFSKKME